jgi:hypothetical protein
MIGFQILDPPAAWTRFIESMEKELDEGRFFTA